MALTNIVATGGGVTMPSGLAGRALNFDWDVAFPEVDITGFGDGGAATFAPAGGVRCTGTVNGIMTYDATGATPFPPTIADGAALVLADLDDVVGNMTLTFQTGCTLAFSSIFSSVGGNRAETGLASIRQRFGSSGQLTLTWDVA